jgi:inner membrane protein
MKEISYTKLSFYIYLFTSIALAACIGILISVQEKNIEPFICVFPISLICAIILGLPGYVFMLFFENRVSIATSFKNIFVRLAILLLSIILIYSGCILFLLAAMVPYDEESFQFIGSFLGFMVLSTAISLIVTRRKIYAFYLQNSPYAYQTNIQNNQNIQTMESNNYATAFNGKSNKMLIKGLVISGLILLMLIPMLFIQNLITERQERQATVVNEVSSKWAKPQTVSAPYIVIPYSTKESKTTRKELILLPEQLDVSGNISEEKRSRSIYTVLLYKSRLNFKGKFHFTSNNEADSTTFYFNEAKLCFGLSDFRGIEDKINIVSNNTTYSLLPGLPNHTIDSAGLSTSFPIVADKDIDFNMDIALKGSGQLHFLPLAAYSNYSIQSALTNPSFDGNVLPTERAVNNNGFVANWKFNAANLPFTTVIEDQNINAKEIAFGFSLVQPVDQYSKSMRSAKYAILIIGLTFAIFFVFEISQKNPVHPIQYALVGIALAIFYTLLVSLSEIILFDYAYLIGAIATITLITMYARSHFKVMKTALLFGSLLSLLYAFIYVLISLEDTALLVGSIALFIVVAIIMFATRNVQWYHDTTDVQLSNTVS